MATIGNSLAPYFTATTSDVFSANGTGTTFTLTRSISNLVDIEVLVNNIQQNPYNGAYSVNGTTLTFSEAPSVGANNVLVSYRQAIIGSTIPTPNTVASISLQRDLTLGGNTTSNGTMFTQALVPTANVTYDIGTSTLRYKDIYLSGATINLGDVSLSASGNTFTVANSTGGTLPSSMGNTTIAGTANVTGDMTIGGNLTVTGTMTYINTTDLNIGDAIISLNADLAANIAPTEDAGISINRGASTNAQFKWIESTDNWSLGNTTVSGMLNANDTIITGTANVSVGINVGANVNLGTTYMDVGNSTVNTTITNVTVSTNTVNVASTINVGANVNLSTSQIYIGNSTVNTVISATSLTTTSNTVSLGTAAYVVANGNVGVGTSSPSAKLESASDGSTLNALYLTDTRAFSATPKSILGFNFKYDSAGANTVGSLIQGGKENSSNNNYAGMMSFWTRTNGGDLTQRAVIDSNGNLGIGTTSPTGKLTVDPGSTSGTRIDGLHLPKNLTAQANYVAWQQGVAGWRVGIVYNDSTYPLAFYYGASTPTASSPGTELMRIDSDGNLGVGVTPNGVSLGGSYKLLSLGKSGGSGIFMGQTDLTTAGSYSAQFLGKTTGASGYQIHGGMVIGAEGSSSTNATGLVTFYTATGGTVLERMRIDSGGYVGIGTTASYSAAWGADSWQLNIGGSRTYSSLILGNTFRFYSMGAGANYHYMSYDHTAAAHNIIVNTTGVVALRGGAYNTATGVGIAFPPTQVASSDPNTLDDYEEGTYTPTQANFSTTGTLTITGRYIKIGNIIHFSVLFSSTGTIGFSTSAFISTPFTVKQATGNITMRVNSNSVSFNGNQSGAQCNTDEVAQARFFVGSFTTTSSGQGLIFAGTFEQH